MNSKYEFIKFQIPIESDYLEFSALFEKIKLDKSKNNEILSNDLNGTLNIAFEDYNKLLSPFASNYFIESAALKSWDYEGVIDMILLNLEIEFVELRKINDSEGILEFDTFSYPYGGTSSLIVLLKSFNLIPFEVNDGTSIDKIEWVSNIDYLQNGIGKIKESIKNEIVIPEHLPDKSNWLTSILNFFKGL